MQIVWKTCPAKINVLFTAINGTGKV